jgi:hypothetical protein
LAWGDGSSSQSQPIRQSVSSTARRPPISNGSPSDPSDPIHPIHHSASPPNTRITLTDTNLPVSVYRDRLDRIVAF